MQDDSLQQIAEREVLQIGEGFQHFHDPLFHADAGLHAFDRPGRRGNSLCYHGTKVPRWALLALRTARPDPNVASGDLTPNVASGDLTP